MQPGVYLHAGVIIMTASRSPQPIEHTVQDILASRPYRRNTCQARLLPRVYTPWQSGFT